MEDKRIKEIFAGTEEMIKATLELEIPFDAECTRVIYTKNREYRFSVGLKLIKEAKEFNERVKKVKENAKKLNKKTAKVVKKAKKLFL